MTKRILTWFLWNTVFTIALFGGFEYGNSNLQNVLLFAVPMLTVFTILLVLSKEGRNAIRGTKDRTPKLIQKVDVLYDMFFTLALAYYGQFILATLYFIHTVFVFAVKNTPNELIENEDEL